MVVLALGGALRHIVSVRRLSRIVLKLEQE